MMEITTISSTSEKPFLLLMKIIKLLWHVFYIGAIDPRYESKLIYQCQIGLPQTNEIRRPAIKKGPKGTV